MSQKRVTKWSQHDAGVLLSIMKNASTPDEGYKQASKELGRPIRSCQVKFGKMNYGKRPLPVKQQQLPVTVVASSSSYRVQTVKHLFSKLTEEERITIIKDTF
ncbi:hypothetical protein KC678_05130 [Candidatus Dojkabacteria bacterium]|uniref:Uncharacterized protein n=1 Tax=Candidatus Dojkabacteria bacterium TaxID=2099670 RepID=A0A955L2D0_9BACT|nr:hypothetical protein [Candidatus Dojkabacteria bacterium]